MNKPLEKEFRWFIAHQDDLLKKYNGRIVVIKDEKVLGDFDSEIEAVKETSKTEELGTFLVQKCSQGTDDYTQKFHSRIAWV